MLVSKIEKLLVEKYFLSRDFFLQKCRFSHHLQQRFGIPLLNRLVRKFQNAVVNDGEKHILKNVS